MEGGALSSKSFPAFAKTVVPFLHVTTKIDGHPYDDLMAEYGHGGFPTLMFADADGKSLGQPTDRTVASFAASVEALTALEEVRARAAAGEGEAQVQLLLYERVLSRIKSQEFARLAAELRPKATPEQLVLLDQALVDDRIWDLAMQFYSGQQDAAVTGLLELHGAGKRPTPSSRSASSMWSVLAQHAESSGDTELIRACAAGMLQDMPDDEGMRNWSQRLTDLADGLAERDDLQARANGGEAGLEARILLIEGRLGVVTLESFRERKEAALAVAKPEERDELLQLEVDIEFDELSRTFWRTQDRDPVGKRMLAILEGDGLAPTEGPIRIAASCLHNWAWQDADLLDRCAAALETRYAGHETVLKSAASMREASKKLRADSKGD